MFTSFSSRNRSTNAETQIADLFTAHGWRIDHSSEYQGKRPDLMIRKGEQCFLVELKTLTEGRADRVLPMLSQAILQAQANARNAGNAQPLAVVSVENASQSLTKQFGLFVERYVPNVAVGLVSRNGLRYFKGAGLEELNAEQDESRWHGSSPTTQPTNLFSDLNQWLLKVLLAPEIPENLLQAPRKKYQNGAELAEAAKVSAMSASRFLQQLRSEGYLDASSRYFALVRRNELFRRWRSAVTRTPVEMPMRFLIRGSIEKQIRSLLIKNHDESCLALFHAAEALELGHVSGVPPYIYVPKLPRPDDRNWRTLAAASSSEVPDLIIRQSPSPQSVFRGAVNQDGIKVSDVIQVWLDVSNHPSRGEEQANLIYEKSLLPILGSRI